MMLQMLMVNTLDHQTALTLQHSLQSITSLMALQAGQLPAVQLGLCGVVQQSQDVRLQMMLRPQPFDLRQWHVALQRVPALLVGSPADSAKTAMALKTLVDFLATDKALASCSKVVTVFGQAFHQVDAFSDVLKVAAEHCIQIDFVAIADGGEGSMSELDLANFATGLADHENASASYCPCDPFAIHQVCLRWLHSVLHPQPVIVTIQLPRPVSAPQASSATTPPHSSTNPPVHGDASSPAKVHPLSKPVSQCGSPAQSVSNQTPSRTLTDPQTALPLSLVCRVVSEVARLSPCLTNPLLCPCHGEPVHLSSPDAQHQLCGCSVSGACFSQAELKKSRCMVQVGHSSILNMPSAQAANSHFDSPGDPGNDSRLHIIKRIKVHELSESLLFGEPDILIPHADSFDSVHEMQTNENSFSGLCQVLKEQQEVLLMRGCIDLANMKSTSWPLHYVATPACNACSMLIHRVASVEELLPVSHLLAGHAPEVPLHVKEGLQKALQTVPVSDYSPLDHHSGALDRITGLLSQSLPHSATPVRSRTAHALPQSASGTPTVPTAPTKPREAQSAQALPPGPSSQAQSAIPIRTRAAVAASAPTSGGGQKAMPSDAVHTRALSAQPAASDSGRQVGSTAWGRPTGAVAQYTQAGQFGFVASGRQSGTDRAASMQAREAAHEAGQAVNAQQPASQAQQANAKAHVRLPPAPAISNAPSKSAQLELQQGRANFRSNTSGIASSYKPPRTVPQTMPVQTQAGLPTSQLASHAKSSRQQEAQKLDSAASVHQTGPRLNFKRIRTLK